jgi:hypothetical protein
MKGTSGIVQSRGREWEYETAQDRTGWAFRGVAHANTADEVRRDMRLFKDPALLVCPRCNQPDDFRIMVDNAPGDSNLVMIGCKCGAAFRAMAMQIPQMSDERAKQLGIWVPPSFQMDIDFDD